LGRERRSRGARYAPTVSKVSPEPPGVVWLPSPGGDTHGSSRAAPDSIGARRRRRRRLALTILAASVVVALIAVLLRTPSALPGPAVPVLGVAHSVAADDQELNDIGDPFILPVAAGVEGDPRPRYILYWTTDWQSNVPTAVSYDLVHWRRTADSLPSLPSWAEVVSPPRRWEGPPGVSTRTWGPTVVPISNGWLLYYSTEEASSRLECVGVAWSGSPTGPFSDTSSAPLVCQRSLGGDIDPSVVQVAPGRRALVWKNDGNAVGAAVSIWSQPLAPDGRSTQGAAVRLVGADQAWEHGIVEGPAMLADSERGWWLFFSGGTWQSDTYDTGVVWCATVAGPCRHRGQGPLLASTPAVVSPGGLDTFVDHQGKLWASYSAFPSEPANAEQAMESPRVLELAPVLSH